MEQNKYYHFTFLTNSHANGLVSLEEIHPSLYTVVASPSCSLQLTVSTHPGK